MTQEQCAGCTNYLNNIQILQKNRENPLAFPLDVEWKNCSMGPDVYLNCKKRLKKQIYVTSEKAFKKHCEKCPELADFEKTERPNFTHRVFCKAEKCIRPKEANTQ
jgi:hypothetical protein